MPREIRYRLAYDKKLISQVLAVFLKVVQGWDKSTAKKQGFKDVKGGSVSFIQRFGSAINVTPHYHSLVLDGVYAIPEDSDPPIFIAAPRPTDEEIKTIKIAKTDRSVFCRRRQKP